MIYLTLLGFPDAIDKLDPEVGQMGGPTPMIFGIFPSLIKKRYSLHLSKQPDSTREFCLRR